MTIPHHGCRLKNLFNLTTVLITWIFIICHSSVFAEDKSPIFVFNQHSEYWPTNGWRTSTPEKQGMSSELLAEMFDEIQSQNLSIYSVVVVKNGYLIADANKRKSDTLYPLWSSTKSVTSAIFGIALEQGYIKNINQPVRSFFPQSPEHNEPSEDAMQLRHLLTMSSGFAWPESLSSSGAHRNPVHQMEISTDWVEFVLNRPMTDKPGAKFNYSSGASHLLLGVLAQVGLDVAEFAQEELFAPLGISEGSYIWSVDPQGIPNGSHGLVMNTNDIAKFGYLYLRGGYWDGRQIVPRRWVEESTRKQIEMDWNGFVADSYGYQWYIQPFGFHSMGYHGQFLFVLPEQNIVVVMASELDLHEFEIPIGFIEQYIIPAASASSALAENKNGEERLKAEIKQFNESRFW